MGTLLVGYGRDDTQSNTVQTVVGDGLRSTGKSSAAPLNSFIPRQVLYPSTPPLSVRSGTETLP